MGKFLSQQQTAAALIARFGGAVQIIRTAAGMLDPVTQVIIGGGDTTHTAVAAVMPAGQHASYIAGTLNKKAALQAYIALKGLAIVPQEGDVMVVGGKRYKVFWVKTYDPAQDGPIFSEAYLEA